MKSNHLKNRLILGVLLCLFISYNISLYFHKQLGSSGTMLTEQAVKGEQLWQDNNCTACHQIYGLGGYLGPDLTNVISHPNKGEAYAKAFFNSGIQSMPKFDFNEDEKQALIAFLKEVDQTGFYPIKNAQFDIFGWVSINYKKKEYGK